MSLAPITSRDQVELVAKWLSADENSRWLALGIPPQLCTPRLVKIMALRTDHCLRLFRAADDDDGPPIGVVALSNIDPVVSTATFWTVLGDKRYQRQGLTKRASTELLGVAFQDLGLHSIHTWVVDGNHSVRLVLGLGFRFVGRQRESHRLEDGFVDRLFFDLLPSDLGES